MSLRDAHDALARTLAALTDAALRAPSRLPGWTRGHVATHLCRNADGINRLAQGILDGAEAEFYPGGQPARNAAIEEGAARPARLIAADHAFAGGRVLDTLERITGDLLNAPVAWRRPITAADLAPLRWGELEIHHVDLDAGYTAADWPAEFVESTLAAQWPRLPEGIDPPDLPAHERLAWLLGRPTRAGLPALPAWPF